MNTITAPFSHGSDTSEAAAASVQPHLGRLEKLVLDVIRSSGGLTCDEAEDITGLSHQTCSARFRQLTQRGLIEDSGVRRRTRSMRFASVYRVTEKQGELL